MLNLIWIIPLLPALGTAINGLAGLFLRTRGARLDRRLVAFVSVAVVLAAFLLSVICVIQLSGVPGHVFKKDLFTWIPGMAMKTDGGALANFEIPWGYQLDPLSAVMILVVTGVGSLIHIYAVGYMWEDDGFYRFFAYLNLFMFAMLTLVLADNYLLMFVGWEGVGLCSYLLIGFYFDRKSAGDAAKKAFVVNRVGDFGFALGMMLIFATFGSLDYTTVSARVAEGYGGVEGSFGVLNWIALLLFIGATGKSAQIPLYVWLPDAMEGPTPVSALIHAATMVTAGIYMVVRSNAIYSRAGEVMLWVAVVGVVTALFAATVALVQRDIKRVLAYSTVSQLGYMFTALGVGAFTAGIFHLMTHAFFKALLFLGAGSVIHGMHHEQDMMRMGGLKKYLPWTWASMWVGTLAIAGVPLLSGFFSKDEILWRAYSSAWGSPVIWGVGVVTAGLTAFYMFRLMLLTFHGKERFGGAGAGHEDGEAEPGSGSGGAGERAGAHPVAGAHERAGHLGHEAIHPHESPWVMVGPLVVLAVLSMVGGYVLVPAWFPVGSQGLEHFLEPVFEHAAQPPAAVAEHGHALEIGLTAVSVLVAALGMGLASLLYIRRPELPARLAGQMRGLYTLLYNKYYVDEIYDAAIVTPVHSTAKTFLWRGVDVSAIDGAVNGIAYAFRGSGNVLKRIQSGQVRAYGTWVLFGAFVVMIYLVAL